MTLDRKLQSRIDWCGHRQCGDGAHEGVLGKKVGLFDSLSVIR
jgi:hypothetical protein